MHICLTMLDLTQVDQETATLSNASCINVAQNIFCRLRPDFGWKICRKRFLIRGSILLEGKGRQSADHLETYSSHPCSDISHTRPASWWIPMLLGSGVDLDLGDKVSSCFSKLRCWSVQDDKLCQRWNSVSWGIYQLRCEGRVHPIFPLCLSQQYVVCRAKVASFDFDELPWQLRE